MLKVLDMAHSLLAQVIEPGDVVVDATMGNGYDTLFLADLAAEVFAFDVQEAALLATEKRVLAAGKSVTKILTEAENLLTQSNQGLTESEKMLTDLSVKLILSGHENVAKFVQKPIKAAIFNLGYLPKADKNVITKGETTLAALTALTEKLVIGGRIAIMIYYGHEGGESEKNAVLSWVSALAQKQWNVFSFAALNQIHQPPILVVLEKRC